MILADTLSVFVIPYTALPFLLAEWRWGVGILVASWLTFLIKQILVPVLGTCQWCRRPAGASNCNTWMNDGDQSGAPGFPSGHVATAAAFWIGLWFRSGRNGLVGILGACAVVIMAAARMQKRCHSWIQVSGGALLGVLVGWVFSYNRS